MDQGLYWVCLFENGRSNIHKAISGQYSPCIFVLPLLNEPTQSSTAPLRLAHAQCELSLD